ncbi:MAG: hypothetical protein GX352_05765 [Clostridiales bacterium]|nr:hypothetical protein [Clostridiales bacterium]
MKKLSISIITVLIIFMTACTHDRVSANSVENQINDTEYRLERVIAKGDIDLPSTQEKEAEPINLKMTKKDSETVNIATPEDTIRYSYQWLLPYNENLDKIIENPLDYSEIAKYYELNNISHFEAVEIKKIDELDIYSLYLVKYLTYFQGLEDPWPDHDLLCLSFEQDQWRIVQDMQYLDNDTILWIRNAGMEMFMESQLSEDLQRLAEEQLRFQERNLEFMIQMQRDSQTAGDMHNQAVDMHNQAVDMHNQAVDMHNQMMNNFNNVPFP